MNDKTAERIARFTSSDGSGIENRKIVDKRKLGNEIAFTCNGPTWINRFVTLVKE